MTQNEELNNIIKTFCYLYHWHFNTTYHVNEETEATKIRKRLLPKFSLKEIHRRIYRAFVNNYWQGVPKSISEFIQKFHIYVVTEPETAVVDLPPMTIEFKKLLNSYYEICEVMDIIPKIITREIAKELYATLQYNPSERLDKLITLGVIVYGYDLKTIVQTPDSIDLHQWADENWIHILETKKNKRECQRFVRDKKKYWSGGSKEELDESDEE